MLLLLKTIYFTALKLIFRVTRNGMMISQRKHLNMDMKRNTNNSPSAAYIAATWACLAAGVITYLIGLWNARIQLNEKGFYIAVYLLGMFSSVTLQKTVRDRAEGIPATNIFMGMCWAIFASSIALLGIGLFNAEMTLSEKGFYCISFVLSLFSIITVQKNIRDMTNEYGETNPAVFHGVSSGWETAAETVDILDTINS